MAFAPQAIHFTIGVLCQMQVVGSKLSDVHLFDSPLCASQWPAGSFFAHWESSSLGVGKSCFNRESILPTIQRIKQSRTVMIVSNFSTFISRTPRTTSRPCPLKSFLDSLQNPIP
jgi:hypothetical protein